MRDYAPYGPETLRPSREHDRGLRYLRIYTDAEVVTAEAWLHAGGTLSAMLLAAITAGLPTRALSDITEPPATRDHMGTLLPGLGHPQVAVRSAPAAGESAAIVHTASGRGRHQPATLKEIRP